MGAAQRPGCCVICDGDIEYRKKQQSTGLKKLLVEMANLSCYG